ncbi:MAG: hypothetical protein NVSMB27_03450 [Ktedonobacteraceae bacterium]
MSTIIPRCTRLRWPVLVTPAGVLIAVILAGSLALLAPALFSHQAFAASLQRVARTTCAQAPTMEHCDNQDPELQGCASDARTLGQAVALVENGFTIGRVERRYSPMCQTWWGRVFDTRIGSRANMFIAIADTTLSAPPTFVGPRYRILYSPMVFDAIPTQQVPAIIGMLEIDGIAPPASATLPPIAVPGK